MNNELFCAYGCGSIAVVRLKNNKPCCSKNTSQCKAVKEKNSNGLKKAYKEGKRICVFTNEHREKTIDEKNLESY